MRCLRLNEDTGVTASSGLKDFSMLGYDLYENRLIIRSVTMDKLTVDPTVLLEDGVPPRQGSRHLLEFRRCRGGQDRLAQAGDHDVPHHHQDDFYPLAFEEYQDARTSDDVGPEPDDIHPYFQLEQGAEHWFASVRGLFTSGQVSMKDYEWASKLLMRKGERLDAVFQPEPPAAAQHCIESAALQHAV